MLNKSHKEWKKSSESLPETFSCVLTTTERTALHRLAHYEKSSDPHYNRVSEANSQVLNCSHIPLSSLIMVLSFGIWELPKVMITSFSIFSVCIAARLPFILKSWPVEPNIEFLPYLSISSIPTMCLWLGRFVEGYVGDFIGGFGLCSGIIWGLVGHGVTGFVCDLEELSENDRLRFGKVPCCSEGPSAIREIHLQSIGATSRGRCSCCSANLLTSYFRVCEEKGYEGWCTIAR